MANPVHHFNYAEEEDPIHVNLSDEDGEEDEYVCMRRKKHAKTKRKSRSRLHQFVLIVVLIIGLLLLGFLWSRASRACFNLFTCEDDPISNLWIAIFVTLFFFIIIYFIEVDDML